MKLVYNKKSKDPSYYVQHSYRIGNKVKTSTILSIGKHSELLKQYPDPLAYANEVVKKYKDDYEKEKNDIGKGKKLAPINDNKIIKSNILNVGYFYLQSIYSKLNIKKFFDELLEDKKIQFNPNDITRFITFDRVLDPKSKYAALGSLANFYEQPKFDYQHILRTMDLLSDNQNAYLSWLFKNSENVIKRDTSVCYYDCTNYYFEVEADDLDDIDTETKSIIRGLRKYGPSKEHRPNPIVEMGLFMDKNGIPLTMGIYPGNMNEQKTVKPLEYDLIKMLSKKEIIYCADAGLGSLSIRTFNSMGGRAFIVTQSIKKLSEELQNEVFNDSGYKLLSNDNNITLDMMKSFDIENPNNINLFNDKAYKSIEVSSDVDLGLYEEKELKNGKIRKIKSPGKLQQRVIITYSRKIAEYQKKIRNKQIERAKQLISKGVDDIRKGPNDIARFIKNESSDKQTYIIDKERIELEEKYDGFYAIATNLMDDNVKEIFEINSQRYKIEECFRVLKTNFDARPIYHRLDSRIKAHFLICYTALLIYRLLELKLKENGYHYTINEILSSLKNMNVSLNGYKYYATYNHAEILDAFSDSFDVDLNAEYFESKYLKKILKNF